MSEPERRHYKAESRRDWWTPRTPSTEEVTCGTLMRIADATEKMAKRHTELIEERDLLLRKYRARNATIEMLHRRLAGTRGYITRLKRKIAELEGKA